MVYWRQRIAMAENQCPLPLKGIEVELDVKIIIIDSVNTLNRRLFFKTSPGASAVNKMKFHINNIYLIIVSPLRLYKRTNSYTKIEGKKVQFQILLILVCGGGWICLPSVEHLIFFFILHSFQPISSGILRFPFFVFVLSFLPYSNHFFSPNRIFFVTKIGTLHIASRKIFCQIYRHVGEFFGVIL